jgi:hypothetical protein
MTIFVSIAAYRDPELIPTLRDCVARARWPDELRFGVCWQHGTDEPRPSAPEPARMRLIDVPWQDSRGACWARAEIMARYDGEDWFLQLDSHHRFVQDWDRLLIEQAEGCGTSRMLLSTYPANYDPDVPRGVSDVATRLQLNGFNPNGNVSFGARPMTDAATRAVPMRARFLGAGMVFAPGRFVADVPYDPELYFDGEELTLAIRAFTHGYDLFHPVTHVLWHQESPRLRVRHWDDHVAGQGVSVTGRERDAVSHDKVGRFLEQHGIGAFGCGTARSFGEYQVYAGLDFRRREATPAAWSGDEPRPARPVAADLRTWRLRIGLDRHALPAAALDQPRFWYVGILDDDDVEISRQDADRRELSAALAPGGDHIVIERHVRSARPPARWTVWPVDRRGYWTERLSGAAEAECVA